MGGQPEGLHVNLSGSQLGDAQIGDIAGAVIYKGASADTLVDLLRYQIDKESQYRILDLKVREIRQEQTDKHHAAVLAELRHQRWILIVGLILIIVGVALR